MRDSQQQAGKLPFGRDGYLSWCRTNRETLQLLIMDEGIEAANKEVEILAGSSYVVPFAFNGAAPQWRHAQGALEVHTSGGRISGLVVRLTPSGPSELAIQVFPPYLGVARLLDDSVAGLLIQARMTEADLSDAEIETLTHPSGAVKDAAQDQRGRAEVGQHIVFWQYWPLQHYLDTVIRHTQSGDIVHASRRSVHGPRRRDEFRIAAKTFDVARFSYSVVTEFLLDPSLTRLVRYDMTLAPVMVGTRHTLFDVTTG